MAEYEVGYGKPPKEHQFPKGKPGCSGGRRGKKPKQKPDNSEAAILKRLDEELVGFKGKKITKREAELRILQNKALQGDTRASVLLDKKRTVAGVDKAPIRGGVLVLPGTMPIHEWEVSAAIQQAKFRGQDPEGLDELMRGSGISPPATLD